MQAIDLRNASITSISSRVDKSLRLSIVTPELTVEQRSVFMELQGANIRALIKPTDVTPETLVQIGMDEKGKAPTPSQQLRAVVFERFTNDKIRMPFQQFYEEQMKRITAGYRLRRME